MMNIVVCIKQVPNTTEVKIDKKTNTLVRSGVESIINPYDMHAIEEGLRIREELGGKVTVISMGPPQVADSLKEAISLGVDDVILLSDRAFAGADSLATSYALAKGIESIGNVDLIICGKQAIDGDTAQVGPGLAEHLSLPHTTYVKEVSNVNDKNIKVKRTIEDGYEVVEMDLPALITVVKEINETRFPSIRGILRSREIEVPVLTADNLEVDKNKIGLNGSPTQVVSVFTPQVEAQTEIFNGEPAEQAHKLVEVLRQQKII